MNLSVSREAALELTDAARYYAKRGGREVGSALIEDFAASLELLERQPQLGAVWRSRRRFVIALAHHRRKPQYWSART